MLGNKVAAGALWLVGARLTTKGLDLLAMLIVARILSPSDFGLVALAATVLVVLDSATDFSLANALIQMRDPQKSTYDTAFTLSVIRSLFLALSLALVAFVWGEIYSDKRLVPMILVLSLSPIFKSLISPRMVHFSREMQFRQAFLLETTGKVASFIVSVSIAVTFKSYWALIAGMIATPAISMVISYFLAPYRPALGLEDWRSIFAFSGWLTLSQAINQLNWQSDRFFIAGKLGTPILGQYTVGSELASLPTQAPVMPMMQALYAGFAKVARDSVALRSVYLKSQQVIMALALPIGLTVSALAEPIILMAIGPKWLEAAFVVKVLAPVFAIQMLTGPAHSAAMATGQTRAIFYRDLTAFVIRVPLILAGLYMFGFIGVVWARVISGLAMIYLNLEVMRRVTGASIGQQVLAPWRSICSSIVMYSVLLAINWQFGQFAVSFLDRLVYVVLSAITGGLIYIAVHTSLWLLANRPAGGETVLFGYLKKRKLI